NSSGSGIYGPNTNYPASNTVGFASNIQKDNTSGAWVQRQFPNAVPPGTYDVTVEVDVYVYRPQTGDRWSVGNGVYVLTNSLYDNPLWWWDPGVPNFQGVGNRFWPGIGLGGQGNSWA